MRSVVDDVRYEYCDRDSDVGIKLNADATSTISGYPGALRSCFENVLRNAVQHGRDGGEVHVQVEKEGSQAVIVVEDQGGGVPEDELEKIFEPFYRSRTPQNATRRSGGLGLAIASRAATLNGGTISARNSANGLRVEIRLPLAT